METYAEFIQNILDTRGRFNCGDEYHERHHIKPKCMGGGDEENNLINLYAREHFIAHKMLAEENPEENSLTYAYACMAFIKSDKQERYELTPEEYEEVRKLLSDKLTGRKLSEETREKIRQSRLGTKASDETKQKLSKIHSGENAYWYGKKMPELVKQHISEAQKNRLFIPEKNPMYGRPWWDENTPQEKIDEWRKHLSESNSGENNPNYGVTCTEEKRNKIISSNKNKKEVVHIGQNGEILGEYRSKREANRQTGVDRQSLGLYCSGSRTPRDGTIWKFKTTYEEMLLKQEENSKENLVDSSMGKT